MHELLALIIALVLFVVGVLVSMKFRPKKEATNNYDFTPPKEYDKITENDENIRINPDE